MNPHVTALGLAPLVLWAASAAVQEPEEASAHETTAEPYVLDRGEGEVPLIVPVGEELVFHVGLEWGVIGAAIGKVSMSAGLEEYRAPVLLAHLSGEQEEGRETAWMRVHATGEHMLYSMDARIETRVQPQNWPQLVYLYTHEGTETRRRELLLGDRQGTPTSSYRSDTRSGAPKGTRIWREPRLREVPAGTVDMVSAIYMMRAFVASGAEEAHFPLLEKKRVWDMGIRRGRTSTQEVAAGRFEAVEVILEPTLYEGEEMDEEDRERFQGLFGLQGAIHVWLEPKTGVPVRIVGDLPVGIITLRVDIQLASHKGTPADFKAIAVQGSAE